MKFEHKLTNLQSHKELLKLERKTKKNITSVLGMNACHNHKCSFPINRYTRDLTWIQITNLLLNSIMPSIGLEPLDPKSTVLTTTVILGLV
jgi:hypothetical protein